MAINNTGPKIQQEKATLQIMLKLYCRKVHHCTDSLCEECADLEAYALRRLTLCRHGENKTICKKCPRHCYRSDYRQKIRTLMRYTGPRMLIYHPLHTVKHLFKQIAK